MQPFSIYVYSFEDTKKNNNKNERRDEMEPMINWFLLNKIPCI